jgi:hypothetical protein
MTPALYDVQADFRRFVGNAEPGRLAELVEGNPAEALGRLGVFRNNSLVTHTTVLSAVYPVTRRVVAGRFFAYAAHEFLRTSLPSHPCLSEFGERFPGFLADFAPAAGVVYLADLARLEWVISRAGLAAAAVPSSMAKLLELPGDPALARPRLDPGARFLTSHYPVDLIWTLHQSATEPELTRMPDEEVYLEVRAHGTQLLRRLDGGTWAFRSAIAAGATLGDAAEAALRQDCAFDLGTAIAKLFAERLVVACE